MSKIANCADWPTSLERGVWCSPGRRLPISPQPNFEVGGCHSGSRTLSSPLSARATRARTDQACWSAAIPHLPSELVSGIRLTTPAETLLAAARDLGVLDLVLMGDSALRLGHCTIDQLVKTAAQRRRGAPMMRRIIGMLDNRSESPWESVMRVLHRAADIPVEPQHEVFDQWGRFVARGDLWIVGTNRLHEFDGGVHREPDVQSRDLTRDRRLIEASWQRFGFTRAQLLNEGASIIASTDTLLGRNWDPARLHRWNALIAGSMLGRLGRARAFRQWQAAR
jgi:hypothetical protein